MNNKDIIKTILRKKLIFPNLPSKKGDSNTIARQLDITLISIGFRLSNKLFLDIAHSSFEDALNKSVIILETAKEIVGDHVKHNVYFIEFPKNVPDTVEFWSNLLFKYFLETGEITTNLLDFPTYGKYLHSYEEMLQFHKKLEVKHPLLKTIDLGQSLEKEQENLFLSLAQSNIPLNKEDLVLIENLIKYEYLRNLKVPIRENKAVINGIRISKFNDPFIDIDTPIDVLRLACYLSNGDITLATPTRFKSFPRSIRRIILQNLNKIIYKNCEKMDDISNYKEEFKRLGEKLHPSEYRKEFPYSDELFDFARGEIEIETFGAKISKSIQNKDFTKSIELLKNKPGLLVRNIDKIIRECNIKEFSFLCNTFDECVKKVSGRVLLSLEQHLLNRCLSTSDTRIFINKKGKGYVIPNSLSDISDRKYEKIHNIIHSEIEDRIPSFKNLIIDDNIKNIAIPLSEKNKTEGFNILPRGSYFKLDNTKDAIRFFMYWKQKSERTDYDLSCIFLDENFIMLEQVSWTCLRDNRETAIHSGDITSAPNGASEFIEVYLNKISRNVKYIIPTVNCFTGENFNEVEESFFGFMERDSKEKGKPFEALSVKNKFELRGDGKVFLPMVIIRNDDGWNVKWIDLNCKGMINCNRIEQNRFSTSLLAKSITEKEYLSMDYLTDIYKSKAENIYTSSHKNLPQKDVVYIGMSKPESIPSENKFYILTNLKDLIPS
jgi:stress response protein SCP2